MLTGCVVICVMVGFCEGVHDCSSMMMFITVGTHGEVAIFHTQTSVHRLSREIGPSRIESFEQELGDCFEHDVNITI